MVRVMISEAECGEARREESTIMNAVHMLPPVTRETSHLYFHGDFGCCISSSMQRCELSVMWTVSCPYSAGSRGRSTVDVLGHRNQLMPCGGERSSDGLLLPFAYV